MGCDDFLLLVILRKCLRCATVLRSVSSVVEHRDINVVPRLLLMACTEPFLQTFLWDIYNTAEVLQVESLMNNGDACVYHLLCGHGYCGCIIDGTKT